MTETRVQTWLEPRTWAPSSSGERAASWPLVVGCVPVEGLSPPREVVLSLFTHTPHPELLLTTPYSYGDLVSHPGLLFFGESPNWL